MNVRPDNLTGRIYPLRVSIVCDVTSRLFGSSGLLVHYKHAEFAGVYNNNARLWKELAVYVPYSTSFSWVLLFMQS